MEFLRKFYPIFWKILFNFQENFTYFSKEFHSILKNNFKEFHANTNRPVQFKMVD